MGEEANGILDAFGLSDNDKEVHYNIKQVRGLIC